MMKKILLTLALLALVTTTAAAADRWGRSSYGTNRYSGSGNFNGYGANGVTNFNGYSSGSSSRSSYGTRTYSFPQQNTIVIQQDLGGGNSVFSSGPLVQYGADAPLYVPQQQPINAPRGWLGRW